MFLFKLIDRGDKWVGCTNRHDGERAGPMLVWPNLGFRQLTLAPIHLGLLFASSFSVVSYLECMCVKL